MLVGEMERRRERIARIEGELSALQSKVESFDRALALCDDRVDPEAAGTVRATRERYGENGVLIRFVRDQVLGAGDAGVDTRSICLGAIAKFGIPVDSSRDVSKYRDTIGWCLRRLEDQDIIEVAKRSRGGHVPSTWRRRQETTLADLRRQEANRLEGSAP